MAGSGSKKTKSSDRKSNDESKTSYKSAETVSPEGSDSSSGSESSGSSVDETNDNLAARKSLNGTNGKARHRSKSARSSAATSSSKEASGSDSDQSDDESGSKLKSRGIAMDVDGPSQEDTKAAAEDATKNLLSKRTFASDFEPPKGFIVASGSQRLKPSGKLQNMTAASDLGGKQIWHISVPANVPLSKLSTISLEGIAKGDRILTHKGIDYAFADVKSNDADSASLMVPTDEKYVAVELPVTRNIRLQGLNCHGSTDNADHFTFEESSVVATKTYEKAPPPEQPAGLRLRNQPLGVVEESKDESVVLPKKKTRKREEKDIPSKQDGEADEERIKRKAEKRARRELKEKKRLAKAAA